MTQTANEIHDLDAAVARLVDEGAVLVLTNPDDSTESWPLARHHRLDEDVLWIRPLHGGRRSDAGMPVFPLGDCLRRGIPHADATIAPTGIRFELTSGQVLELRPAATEVERQLLDLWDAFTLTVLTAQEEADLDRLVEDSWQGRFT